MSIFTLGLGAEKGANNKNMWNQPFFYKTTEITLTLLSINYYLQIKQQLTYSGAVAKTIDVYWLKHNIT